MSKLELQILVIAIIAASLNIFTPTLWLKMNEAQTSYVSSLYGTALVFIVGAGIFLLVYLWAIVDTFLNRRKKK